MEVTPVGYKPVEAAKVSGTSKTKIYEALNEGRLRARKCGASTIILRHDLLGWLNSLPEYEPRAA